ncbi:uncharacterized protein HaLaN_17031 [Haematococcus lacustris]|uniref:Uncharacterized protein n=1 Tax=Haematococcus lacustris TaxID=44745 RepID=A0A699ZBD6_HAELA|nr:uncharacterized protein HaLaN_17031 [Haematococcus lacustris]
MHAGLSCLSSLLAGWPQLLHPLLLKVWHQLGTGQWHNHSVASDLARRVLRPADLDEVQAVVALLDARSTLRDIAALAATGPESKERFDGRKLWPAYARWLREAGPAAPTVARLVTGSTDGEDTLSEMYGGKAELPGVPQQVYEQAMAFRVARAQKLGQQ